MSLVVASQEQDPDVPARNEEHKPSIKIVDTSIIASILGKAGTEAGTASTEIMLHDVRHNGDGADRDAPQVMITAVETKSFIHGLLGKDAVVVAEPEVLEQKPAQPQPVLPHQVIEGPKVSRPIQRSGYHGAPSSRNGTKPKVQPKQSNRPIALEPEDQPKSRSRRAKSGRGRSIRERTQDDPEQDIVRMYLKEIGRYPLLTKDDEVRLAQAIEAGSAARAELDAMTESGASNPYRKRELQRTIKAGKEANEQFINSNLRLVVSIAKRYTRADTSMRLLDLIQEGNLGLIHAVEKFEWRKGFKFSTYGTWWIRQAITRGIADKERLIRLPVHAGDTLKSVEKLRNELNEEKRKKGLPEATNKELADALEISLDKLTEILVNGSMPLSLDKELREDGDATLSDVVDDRSSSEGFERVENMVVADEINEVLDRVLDGREKTIVVLRFGLDRGEPRTLEEVGEYFNLTRERIRQIEARAMSKLRHPATGDGLKDIL